jgi:hypothetical protein
MSTANRIAGLRHASDHALGSERSFVMRRATAFDLGFHSAENTNNRLLRSAIGRPLVNLALTQATPCCAFALKQRRQAAYVAGLHGRSSST